MASPKEELKKAQGLAQPLRMTEGIVNGDLAKVLTDASAEAHKMIAQNLLKQGVGAQMRAKQLQAATEGLGKLSAAMWGKIGALTRSGIYGAAELAADQALDRDYLTGMPFKAIQQYADEMYFSAYQSAEDIISRHTNGFTLQQRVYRNSQATVMQVGKIVDQGLALQLSAREIAARVRQYVSPLTPGGVNYAAKRLARTEINNAHHDTTIRLTEVQPWTLGYQWNLSGSHPRPDICDSYAHDDHDDMGEGVFAKDNVPSKPHPQCLCYISIVQEDQKEFDKKLIQGKYDSYLKDMGVSC